MFFNDYGSGSKVVPSPYVWTPQPQRGTAAGASQDYSTKMNWLSAGPAMVQRVNGLREARNQILMQQALRDETARPVLNPPVWPAAAIQKSPDPPITLTLPRDEALEEEMTDNGAQLAGGLWPGRNRCARTLGGAGLWTLNRAPLSRGISGGALSLNDNTLPSLVCSRTAFGGVCSSSSPAPWTAIRPDGTFQLGGTGPPRHPPAYFENLTLSSQPSQPRAGGIGLDQFVTEFIPSVYLNPFSGGPGTFPDQFQANYDIVSESVAGYD